MLYGEHGLVPCFDELAVVIPEIPAHFQRGQLGEESAPVEAVLPASLVKGLRPPPLPLRQTGVNSPAAVVRRVGNLICDSREISGEREEDSKEGGGKK